MNLNGKKAKRVCDLELHEHFIFAGRERKVHKVNGEFIYYRRLENGTCKTGATETLMKNSLMYVEVIEPQTNKIK